MNKKISHLKTIFRSFFGLTLVLVCIGLLFIYSASSIYADERFGSSFYFLQKQLLFFAMSMGACIILSFFSHAFLMRMLPLFFLGSLCAVLAALLSPFSLKVHGSHRWLLLAGWSLQPGEFLKCSFVAYSAYLLSRAQNSRLSLQKTFLRILGVMVCCCLLVLKQPDFGTSITLFLTTLCLFFAAGIPWKTLGTVVAFSCPLVIFGIIIARYRIHRILNFLDPSSDPQGRGYQMIQSLIAVGSGGLWGVGISHSRQKFFYLPMQHTDFIFSIIAEETGFVGSLLLISCYLVWCYLGIKLATLFSDPFSQYVTFGFVSLITIQVLINVCVALGLAPTKGMSLPFISYGGSSLLSNFIMIGIIAQCVRHAVRFSPST